MTDKLTYADSTQILKDWAAEFPGMVAERRTMRVWKRIGPLLMYVGVYTRSIAFPGYKPQFAIHKLYQKAPSPGSMSLVYPQKAHSITWKIDRLPKNWDEFSEDFKEKILVLNNSFYNRPSTTLHYDGYLAAAENIRKNSWIKTSGPITLDDIWQGTENYLQSFYKRAQHYEATIPVYTAIWAGEHDKAREYFKWWECWAQKFKEWSDTVSLEYPEESRKLSDQAQMEDIENWKNNMIYYMDYPDELRQIVKEEVITHKLEKVPYQNIVGVRYQE